MSLIAYVDWGSGRALVFDGDRPIHSLRAGEDEIVLEDARGIHLGMWEQAGGPLDEADPGSHPYSELRQRLWSMLLKHDAFRQILFHFDDGVSEQLRREMLSEIEEDLENPEILAFIIEQFKSKHLPDSANMELLRANPKYVDIVSAIEEGRRNHKPIPVQPYAVM